MKNTVFSIRSLFWVLFVVASITFGSSPVFADFTNPLTGNQFQSQVNPTDFLEFTNITFSNYDNIVLSVRQDGDTWGPGIQCQWNGSLSSFWFQLDQNGTFISQIGNTVSSGDTLGCKYADGKVYAYQNGVLIDSADIVSTTTGGYSGVYTSYEFTYGGITLTEPTPTPTATPTDGLTPSDTPTPTPTETSSSSSSNSSSSTSTSSSSSTSNTCTNQAPGTPSVSSVRKTGGNEIEIDWNHVDRASSWTIAYGKQKDKRAYGISDFGNSESRSVKIGMLPMGVYYLVIKANNGCMPGSFSEERVITVSSSGAVLGATTTYTGGSVLGVGKSAAVTPSPIPTEAVSEIVIAPTIAPTVAPSQPAPSTPPQSIFDKIFHFIFG